MVGSELDTRAVLVGAGCVLGLGLLAIRGFESPLVLAPLGFVGGLVSGYVTRAGYSATTNGTIGAVVGFLLVTPVAAGRSLAGREGLSDLSIADSAFFVLVIGVGLVALVGLLVMVSGYLGGMLAELLSDSGATADEGHRYFE